MKFQLQCFNIQEIGKRTNQEDSLFPAFQQQKDSDRLFILCDGMGGHAKGEVASDTVCQAMSASVFRNCPDPEAPFSDDMLRQAIQDAFDALDAVEPNDRAIKKMGTTMTFLKLHANGATVAHMGDSRVYHVRPGKTPEETQILFMTEDHSLVNDLVKVGELTKEEARTSRQKNIITRAMQPHMERRPRADIKHIVDIRPGDYFFMCSDGILERWEDLDVQRCFADSYGDDITRVNKIISETNQNADNHTAIIVKIAGVEGTAELQEPVQQGYYEQNQYGYMPPQNENTPVPEMQRTNNMPYPNPAGGNYSDGRIPGNANNQMGQIPNPVKPNNAPLPNAKADSIAWFWGLIGIILALIAIFVYLVIKFCALVQG